MEKNERIEKLKEQAIKCGATPELIKQISTNQIVISEQWVRWKCQYGCSIYGNNLCCPPFTPSPKDTLELIHEYKTALLIGFKIKAMDHVKLRKKMQRCMLKVENKAFALDYLKALAFNVGGCVWCEKCIVKELDDDIHPKMARVFCRHKDKARPSMEAVGIDVFGTVENAQLELKILTKEKMDEAKFFGLLLLE